MVLCTTHDRRTMLSAYLRSFTAAGVDADLLAVKADVIDVQDGHHGTTTHDRGTMFTSVPLQRPVLMLTSSKWEWMSLTCRMVNVVHSPDRSKLT